MDKTILMTDRLMLRQATLDDAEFFLQLVNAPKYLEHIGDRKVSDLESARSHIQSRYIDSYEKNGYGLWVVFLNDEHIPIGTCGLLNREELEHVDIGFAFLPEYEGFGYATEAASMCLKYARKDLEMEKVVAIVSPQNTGSRKLLEKVGLQFEKQIEFEGKPVLLYT